MNFSDMGSVEREIKQTIADCLKVELSSLKDELYLFHIHFAPRHGISELFHFQLLQ